MTNYIKILKELAAERKITIKDLAQDAGLTEAGFHRAVKKDTLRVAVLLKMCARLEVDPVVLFSNEVIYLKENNPTYGMSDTEILKKVLKTVLDIESEIVKKK